MGQKNEAAMLSFSSDMLHELNITALRINSLSKLYGQASMYLEIGVQKGSTFFNVDMENKFAVDPNFLFEALPCSIRSK
ncbi:hypothetical protein KL86DPRO_11437 [uncultured delta proteobacterium]|uniref:Uncharacterized protein n=1 Tax=uncultured delta proteobacterium TaxID=34034 RepID=A0A212JH28_9DELT|nr:hypothetical protein KL86DPRO_11437 [uncultured delta proteobacterium]